MYEFIEKYINLSFHYQDIDQHKTDINRHKNQIESGQKKIKELTKGLEEAKKEKERLVEEKEKLRTAFREIEQKAFKVQENYKNTQQVLVCLFSLCAYAIGQLLRSPDKITYGCRLMLICHYFGCLCLAYRST